MKSSSETNNNIDYAAKYRRDRPSRSLSQFHAQRSLSGPEKSGRNLPIRHASTGSDEDQTPDPACCRSKANVANGIRRMHKRAVSTFARRGCMVLTRNRLRQGQASAAAIGAQPNCGAPKFAQNRMNYMWVASRVNLF